MKRVVVIWAALGCAGCLGDPTPVTCADTPDAPGCVDGETDVETPDEGPARDAEPSSDVGSEPDDGGSPDSSLEADSAPPSDAGPEADMMPPPDAMAGECTPGTSRACGSAVGACSEGQQFCNAEGTWDMCLGAVEAIDESCNGVDDDCDATTDEGCDCVDGTTQACGSDEGVCRQGTQTCVDGAWDACDGEVIGRAELCDNRDEDCDGTIDEVAGVGEPCAAGLGACRREGALTCLGSEDGLPVCGVPLVQPGVETCNGIDDDCNGAIDDGVPARPDLLQPSQRLPLGVDTHVTPAVARSGAEFHGIAWVDDGRVRYGIAGGDAWEVEPNTLQNYDGNDTIAHAVAADVLADDAVIVAVAYDGLGSGIDVQGMGGDALELGDAYRVDTDGSAYVDVAASGGIGFGIVWIERDRQDDTDHLVFEWVRNGRQAFRRTVAYGQEKVSAPRLVWTGDAYALTFVVGDVRGTTGSIYGAVIDPDRPPARVVPTLLSETGSGATPDVAWLPNMARLAFAWTQNVGNSPRVHFLTTGANLQDAGRPQVIGGNGDARHPALMPETGRRDLTTIGISYLRGAASPRSVVITWMLYNGEAWLPSPTVSQLTDEVVDAAGPVGAWANDGSGYGIAIAAEGAAMFQGDGLMFITGAVGCPQQP